MWDLHDMVGSTEIIVKHNRIYPKMRLDAIETALNLFQKSFAKAISVILAIVIHRHSYRGTPTPSSPSSWNRRAAHVFYSLLFHFISGLHLHHAPFVLLMPSISHSSTNYSLSFYRTHTYPYTYIHTKKNKLWYIVATAAIQR